jgi:hypothetical protein
MRAFIAVCVIVVAGWTDIAPAGAAPATAPPSTVPTTAPAVTINEFMPEERGLGDCISAIPKPGCGSEARGGWRQTLVFVVLVAGLALIAWRVVVSARKARREQVSAN